MSVGDVLKIIVLTLVVWSIITTAIIQMSGCNDTIIDICAMGIVGCGLAVIFTLIRKIQNYFKYHYNKRSIFKNKNNGTKYICHVKDCNDVNWNSDYRLVKRYATESEWSGIPEFSNEFIEKCKRNCNNCKYNNECRCIFPYKNIRCKHDDYGQVMEFNEFRKK